MESNNQEYCSICSEKLNTLESTGIAEIMNILQFIIVSMNCKLLQDALICHTCLLKAQAVHKFKTSYLDVSQKKLSTVEEKQELEHCIICEICKSIIKPNKCIPLFNFVTDSGLSLIKYFSTEVESKINGNFYTCEQCHISLINFFDFTNSLSIYDQDHIDLVNESGIVYIKEEPQKIAGCYNCSIDENFRINVDEEMINPLQDVKDDIEIEESQLKYEDIDLKMDKEDFLKVERAVQQSEQDENYSKTCDRSAMFECNSCKFETEYTDDFKQYMLEYENSDNVEGSKSQTSKLMHKNFEEIEIFICQKCEFKTQHARSLKIHMLVHNNSDEAEMFKCHKCKFETKWKGYLVRHMLVHKNSDEIEVFKCQICKFKTQYRISLDNHKILHNSDIEIFKCQNCEFQTKHISIIKKHVLTMYNFDEVEMFKCNHCEFKTKWKGYISRHMLEHKHPDDTKVFKCHICKFNSKYKSCLKKHMLIHKSSDEIKMFKCPNCEFKTKVKWNLNKHIMLLHTNTDEVKMFKCHNCEFETKVKWNLKIHMLLHKNSDEVEIFKCQKCEFETKYKMSLRRHMVLHKNSDEVEMFKCNHCEFETKWKGYLNKHMLLHKS